MKPWVRVWRIAKTAVADFSDDDVVTLAAALSYYTALSLAPLLVLLLWIGGMLGESTQQGLVQQIVEVMGPQAGQAVELVLDSAAEQPSAASLAGLFGIVTLLVSATTVFGQLQYSLNRIWNVKAAKGGPILPWLRKRIASLGMVATIAFLMMVSLAVNAALAFVADRSTSILELPPVVWEIVNFVVSLAVFTLLFAALFKFLPDVRIGWRDVLIGALITALMFTIGKRLISLYLGRTSVGSAYGTAGSLLVLLVWVYFSSIVVFFGAEITQAWSRFSGRTIRPDSHAEWLQPPEDVGFVHAEEPEREPGLQRDRTEA